MFIKSLTISSEHKIIREIIFRNGINLIVDETPITNITQTGNDVGKTTVLKLIDFCLGGKANGIYLDPESRKNEYTLVKDYLIKKRILITLVLKENLEIETSKEVVIERNFLLRKDVIRRIDGVNFTNELEFILNLSKTIFPNLKVQKPSFRQIISHNIRYDDESIINTLRTLDYYAKDTEYETLHLFLLGCSFEEGDLKQELTTRLNQEILFKRRLEKNQTKTGYESALALIESDIENLNKQKESFNLNENFEKDLDNLNVLKYQIVKKSSEISRLNIRKEIILDAKKEMESNVSHIDTHELQLIYQQAKSQLGSIQKTFENLLDYHNQMIKEKIKFITQELPNLDIKINFEKRQLKKLLDEENQVTRLISKSDSFESLESLVAELNEKYRKKGEFENNIHQIGEIEKEINRLGVELNSIDEYLFSDEFESKIKIQRDKFNKHFASISEQLYGERYGLIYDKINNSKNQRVYKFSTFTVDSPNLSSGKKQGEISCFDIAYTIFADENNIPCLHFILNDKKELMHDNQLVLISNLVNKSNVQFIASILKDKLPDEINKDEYIILKLSQQSKLFKIEESN